MKKTVTINISGRVFYIDDDAYQRLSSYLEKIESAFKSQESGHEIISDIESRVAEIFEEKIDRQAGVVTINMVEEVISTMGEPEEITDEPGIEEERAQPMSTALVKPSKRLYRDIDNRIFGGVCAGIAAYFNVDSLLVRIIAVILIFLTSGVMIPVYIILWMALPPAITTAQKLEMRGQHITVNNIEKSIRDEYEEMKHNFSKMKESPTYKKGENFFRRMTRRDRTVLVIVAVILGSMFLWNLPGFNFNFVHGPIGAFTNLSHGFGSTFGHIFFPGALSIVLVLLVIGLIFKTVFKVILYIIAFLLLGALALKVFFWMFGGFGLMC